MKRFTLFILFIAIVAAASALHEHLSAQEVVDVPTVTEAPAVVSPTYVAIPPRRQELITTSAPSPQYVWIAGQWERTPASWSWTNGKWVQPPFSNAYWVPGYWRHNSGKYVWQAAHWGVANQGVIVNKPVTVPPVYAEVRPAAPAGATGLAWQPGYWDWRGTWVWVPGEYITTSSPKAVWVPGAWETAVDGTWRWSPAHWAVT